MRLLSVPCIVLLVLADPAHGRDRVVLQPPDKSSRLVLSGSIADYTAEVIEIHLTVGKPVHRYSTSEVVAVQTVQTESHRKGVRLFQQGALDQARIEFEQALKTEPRTWVQREILGWMVKIALRRGNRTEAGGRFLQIMASSSTPREYALIPLVWSTARVDDRLRQQARLWMSGTKEIQRLLGACVQLNDPQYGEIARSELDRLSRVSDRRIAELARFQLRRLRVTAPDVTEDELRTWEAAIEKMPAELRAGPYYLLGRARQQRSEYDRAAAAFLWLPTVYRENEPLTARSAVDAATAMKRAGRLTEAESLLTEITTDYGWSPAAGEARSLLAEIGDLSH